ARSRIAEEHQRLANPHFGAWRAPDQGRRRAPYPLPATPRAEPPGLTIPVMEQNPEEHCKGQGSWHGIPGRAAVAAPRSSLLCAPCSLPCAKRSDLTPEHTLRLKAGVSRRGGERGGKPPRSGGGNRDARLPAARPDGLLQRRHDLH